MARGSFKKPDAAQRWDPPGIKAELQRRGLTLSALGVAHGLSRAAASKALRNPYPPMERLIAEALGVAPEKIWPERYDNNGNTLHPRGRPRGSGKTNTRPSHRNVQHRAER